MLRHALVASKYIVYIAILGTFITSLALLVYEALVIATAVADVVREGAVSPKIAKALAVVLCQSDFDWFNP